METIRYGLLGREDVKVGTGTFTVELADGRQVVLSALDVGAILNDPTLFTAIVNIAPTTGLTIPSFTLAGLPAAGTAGRLARVTNNIRGVWKDTGTQWISVTGYADVHDFGAVGDGVTDDAAAIQAAIDASSNIAPAMLQNKLYKANSALTINTNFQGLKGRGVGSVIWGNHTGRVLQVGNGVTERVGIAVENLHLWSPTGTGLLVTQANKSHFANIWSWSAGACMTFDELSLINTMENLTCSSNLHAFMRVMYPLLPVVTSTGNGIVVQRTTAESNALTFLSPLVEGVGGDGIRVTGTHVTITLINPVSEGNTGWGYFFDGATGYNGTLTLINAYAESNTAGAMSATKQQRMMVLGGQLSTVSGANVSLTDVQNSTFRNIACFNFTEDSTSGANTFEAINASGTFTRNGTWGTLGQDATWTPTFVSTGATFTYALQVGRYARIGKLVVAQFYLQASASGTVTNALTVAGLPFTSLNVANVIPSAAVGFSDFTTFPGLTVIVNNTRLNVWQQGTITQHTPTTSGMNAGTKFLTATVSYFTP